MSDDGKEEGWKEDSMRRGSMTCEAVVVTKGRYEEALSKGDEGVRMNREGHEAGHS